MIQSNILQQVFVMNQIQNCPSHSTSISASIYLPQIKDGVPMTQH